MKSLEPRIALLEAKKREKEAAERRRSLVRETRVQRATADTYTWASQYTRTYNEHWVEEGRPSPYEPFPSAEEYPHLPILFEFLEADERIHFIEKSRDLMISWACVAYFTFQAMTVPQRGVLFQTQKKDKVIQLVKYAKTLYENQPAWLKEAFPLSKPLRQQPELSLEFAHGSKIVGLPAGADQIRSYHPWGYLLDEASFVTEAGECYNAALPVVKGKIVFNSSAGPGWYADVRHGIIRNDED